MRELTACAASAGRRRVCAAGEVLALAGNAVDVVLVVEAGALELHSPAGTTHVLGPGDGAGAWAVLAPGPWRVTVVARADAVVVEFDCAALRALLAQNDVALLPLHKTLQQAVVDELRAVHVAVAQERARASVVVVGLTLMLSAAAFTTDWLTALVRGAAGTTATTAPLVLLVLVALALPVWRLRLPARAYGITTTKLAASLVDGVLFAVPLVLLCTAVKVWAVATLPAWHGLPVFDVTTTLTQHYGDASRAATHFVIANGVYVLLVVPLQEFVCRGVLQEQLERLLSPPRARAWAIVTSSAAFGACHLYLSWGVAAATVVLSAYIGVVYGRTRNLVGACVLHAIVGTWALSVVRLQPLLAGAP